jgi:type I site-specific restriction endonuclease
MFTPLHFPKTPLKISKKENEHFVWCVFRKKELKLTPEEWVRQHALHFMVQHKSIPQALIASEWRIEVNSLDRRCDAVVFNRNGEPVAIVECKAPSIPLTEKTLHQIAQYNYKLKVNWLILTNGLQTIVAIVNQSNGDVSYIEEIPSFEELCQDPSS